MSILFIAGGQWQKPFVEYIKSKKEKLYIVNPVETETTKLADYHIKCDINDLETINEHIEKLNPNIITSDQSDISTSIVSILSEKWKLPCNSIDVIEKFTNKHSIYKFGKSIGVKVPETALIDNVDDITKFSEIHGFPIIIKPVDATMSRGFCKICSASEITKEILETSIKFSKSGKVIVQKYIPGNMVTLEGVCSNGKHKTLATSIKIDNEYFKPGITSSVIYPARISDFFLEKIIEANDKYVEMSGMQFGLTHSEFIISEGCFLEDFHLIEIGARGGGAGIADKIVPWVSGVDTYEIFYNSLNGVKKDIKSIVPLKRSAALKYYRKEDVSESQACEIKKITGVSVFCHNFKGTQYVSDDNDCRYTLGIYLADDLSGLKIIEEKIDAILKK